MSTQQYGSVTTGGPLNSGAGMDKPSTHINFSTPAGWALIWWFLSVVIIGALFLSV